MKRLYEKIEESYESSGFNETEDGYLRSHFFEIELDEKNLKIKTRQGKLIEYYVEAQRAVFTEKKFKNLKAAQADFETQCKKWEDENYVLSPSNYPFINRDNYKSRFNGDKFSEIFYFINQAEFDEMVKNKKITYLDISPVRFDFAVSENIVELENLEELVLSSGCVSLPDNIGALKNLKVLNIAYSKVVSLPESIGDCSNLREIRVGASCKKLPESIGRLKKLRKINCSGSGLASFPDSIGDCTNLIEIDAVESENLSQLSKSFGKLKNLRFLNLAVCKFKHIPPEIGGLQNLIELDISNNDCAELPTEIGGLEKLQKLELSKNKLKTLPIEIGQLKNLEELHLAYNKLESLPDGMNGMENLRELHLEDNNLKNLPESFCNSPNLTELHLQNNKLNKLPDNFANLTNLESLQLYENKLKELPKEMGGMKLEDINLANNQLKNLPESFFELTKLFALSLYGNKLTEIVPQFSQLRNVINFNIKENPIKNVSPKILESSHLRTILKHLKIETKDIVSQVENLWSLEELGAILESYHDKFDNVKKVNAKNKFVSKEEINALLDFLLFKTNEIPIVKHSQILELEKVFAPLAKWGEVENRLMHFLVYNHWGNSERILMAYQSNIGFAEIFFNWYKGQITQGTEPDYKDVLTVLEKYGVAENAFDIALGLLYNHLIFNGQVTKFGQVVLEAFKEKGVELFYKYKQNEYKIEGLVDLLIRFDLERLDPHLETIFFGQSYGYPSIQFLQLNNNLRLLCSLHPEKYEHFILRMAQLADSDDIQAQLAMDLHSIYQDKHRELVIDLITESLNGIQGYYRTYYDKLFIPTHGESTVGRNVAYFKWILTHFKETLKEFIFKIAPKFRFHFDTNLIKAFVETYQQEAVPFIVAYFDKLNDDSYTDKVNEPSKVFALLQGFDYSEFDDKIWSLLSNGIKKARIAAAKDLAERHQPKELLPKLKELLNGNAEGRDGAIRLAAILQNNEADDLLIEAFEKEKNAVLRESFLKHLESVGKSPINKKTVLADFETAKESGKLKKFVLPYVVEEKLPAVYWKNGEKVDPTLLRFLFKIQKGKIDAYYELSREVKMITDDWDKTKSGDFARELLTLALDNGGIKVKNKPILAFTTAFGDESVIADLKKYCIDKKSVFPAQLLGNLENKKAARALNGIMLHYKTKYPNIKQAAQDSFDKIAQKIGLNRMELMDEMIPDFGFEQLFKEFKVEDKTYRAYINSELKLVFLDDLDKVRKSLPTNASTATKAAVKALKKDIREISKDQKKGLELNFVSARKWETTAWQKHFMNKPLMFAFAQSLIWGVYIDGKLKSLFAVNQDQSLEDANFDEITLPDNAHIGMVHPIELTDKMLVVWRKYLVENNLKPIFEQMNRPVFRPEKATKEQVVLDNFDGDKLNPYTFVSTLDKRAWRRGPVEDAGYVADYRKMFETHKIQAILNVDSLNVILDVSQEFVELGDLWFMQLDPTQANLHKAIPIKELPPIVYSETMYDMELLMAKKIKD